MFPINEIIKALEERIDDTSAISAEFECLWSLVLAIEAYNRTLNTDGTEGIYTRKLR